MYPPTDGNRARWLAVRNDDKVLGFYRVADSALNADLLAVYQGVVPYGALAVELFKTTFMLEMYCEKGLFEPAIDSHGHGVEFWRDVKGFVEAVPT